jgi:hypothetical protein
MKLLVWSGTPSDTVWSSPDSTEVFSLVVSHPFHGQIGCFTGLDSPAQSSILTAVEDCLRGRERITSLKKSGMGSGIGWPWESVRGAARRCGVASENQAVESSDFCCAAFWCTCLPKGLPGF